MASTFPPAYHFLELIQDCVHMDNVFGGNIVNKDESVLLSVNTKIVSSLFHMEEKKIIDPNPALSVARFP